MYSMTTTYTAINRMKIIATQIFEIDHEKIHQFNKWNIFHSRQQSTPGEWERNSGIFYILFHLITRSTIYIFSLLVLASTLALFSLPFLRASAPSGEWVKNWRLKWLDTHALYLAEINLCLIIVAYNSRHVIWKNEIILPPFLSTHSSLIDINQSQLLIMEN